MERENGEIINLSDLEMDLLDEIYFVTPFSEIIKQLKIEPEIIKQVLKKLIQIGYVHQLVYNQTSKDFEKNDVPDYIFIERHSYLASKQGLFAHNTLK